MARSPYGSLEVPLPPDIRERTYAALFDDCLKTVRANANRDQEAFMLRQQLEGVAQPGGDGPWPNSCLLEDTLPRELHTTAHANICAAFRQKPYATFEALQPQHDQSVGRLETLANSEAQLFGFDTFLSTVSYIALEGRYCVGAVEYSTSQTKRKELRDLEEPEPGEGLPESGKPPQTALWQVNETTEQFEFRSIDPWDFYLSPVGSNKVEKADRVYERVWMTRSSLLDGVRNESFDPEEVKALLKTPPTAISQEFSPRREQQQLQGVQEDAGSSSGFYECYKAVGRMPYLIDSMGEQQVPTQFLDEDYLWIFCPERRICVKHVYRPYPVRNYATGKAIGTDDQLIGHGVVSSVAAIADELTILLRAAIDSVNATMDPQTKVPEAQLGWYSQHDVRGPGRYLPYRGPDPNVIQEVRHDYGGLEVAMQLGSSLYARAQRMVAAEGVNAMAAGKVRKAAEVEFQQQVLQNKFGLILNNLQRMVEDVFRIYMAMRKHTLPEGHSVRRGGELETISRDDFDVPYRIIPHADADNASSTARLQRDKAIYDLLHASPLYQQRLAMGDWDGEWMLLSMMLSHMSIPNAEAYIGPAPQTFDATAVLRRILPLVMQGAQAQDPVAVAIMQAVQQMRQQSQQGGGQGQAGTQGRNLAVAPGMGMTLPAIPGSDSAAQGTLASRNGAGGGY